MKFKTNACMLVFWLSVALGFAVPSEAQKRQESSLIEFDPPGTISMSTPACAPSCGTFAYANNSEGVVVGTYTDANVVPHGFLRSQDGEFTSFDAPGAGTGTGLD